jgi:hypothetical protein
MTLENKGVEMSTDIKLDNGQNQDWVTIEAAALQVQASDVVLDQPTRRINHSGFRRALVHDFGDGLTMNFNGDYPGGVTIINAQLNIKTTFQDSVTQPQLPQNASVGDLILVSEKVATGPLGAGKAPGLPRESALWLCVDFSMGAAQWQMLLMGNRISGTA